MVHHERSRDAIVFGVLKSYASDAVGVEVIDPRVGEGHQER